MACLLVSPPVCYLFCLITFHVCAAAGYFTSQNQYRREHNLLKKIYVGNLSFQATEDDVRGLFEAYGTVESVAMINDRDSGSFRGFCFVEMEAAEAQAAITALDGTDVEGRALKVNEARPREERSGGGPRGGSRGGGPRSDSGRRNDYSSNKGGNRRW